MSWKFTALLFLNFIGIFLMPLSAYAAKVANMTDMVQEIEVRTAEGYVPAKILPYRYFSQVGAFHVKYRHHELYLRENMEYAIWPGDVFGPQRVIRGNTKGL